MCSFTQKRKGGFTPMKDEKGKDSFTPMRGKKGKGGSCASGMCGTPPPTVARARARAAPGPRPPASSRVGREVARRARPPRPGGAAAAKNPIE